MFWSKPNTISFAQAQTVLTTVLRDVKCDDWALRVSSISSVGFSSLLGGMGSFSDLIICRENGHQITAEREPLANELMSCMSSICHTTSKRGDLTAHDAIACCGTLGLVLSGWLCRICGYGAANDRALRSLIAANAVREAIRTGIQRQTPEVVLLGLWTGPEDWDGLQALRARSVADGIQSLNSDGWMRPCPVCGSEDTCVYRWSDNGLSFQPTSDNLPIRAH